MQMANQLIALDEDEQLREWVDAFRFDCRQVLSDDCLRAVAPPVAGSRSSFQLHAALEMLAREILFDYVEPSRVDLAALQVFLTARVYEQFRESVPMGEDCDRVMAAIRSKATAAGQDVDQLVRTLADRCLGTTAGASHLHILLANLLGLTPSLVAPTLAGLPGIAAELGKSPRTEFSAYRAFPEPGTDVQAALARTLDRLHNLPKPGAKGFGIHPMLMSVLDAGLLAEFEPDLVTVASDEGATDTFFRTLCRLAAQSMVEEPDSHVKYGWTHCLTLPAAAWQLVRFTSSPALACVSAMLYFCGFRASVSGVALSESLPYDPALEDTRACRERLATRASVRVDAHHVKYIAAIFEMLDRDPEAAPLYLAAADRLDRVWCEEVPDDAIGQHLLSLRGV